MRRSWLWLWAALFLPWSLRADIVLVEFHGPIQHQRIFVNPTEVTSIREPLLSDHFTKGVRCLVYLTNKNFVTVTEDCPTVRSMLQSPRVP